MEIVSLKKADLARALTLVWAVFREFEAPDYAEQGIAEFRKFIAYDAIAKKFDRGELLFWGCFDQAVLTGVVAVRDLSHVCLLFVKKEYHRQGIARALLETVEAWCKTQAQVNQITVNASPYAVEAYRRLGFSPIDNEREMNGIRFTPMVRRL